ncbi:MAG: DUF72 domain-containing protein [Deltaproteobacteria bacterium]|nr:DUF72 domain-containing protein [Deltaproteobacteria bacterium]
MDFQSGIHIGTSGWSYKHWKGPFYPPDLPLKEFLGFYMTRFRTVEINSSFYHLPLEKTLDQWRDAAPPGFIFAVKASRFITHMKRLKDPRRSVPPLLERVRILKDRLGPILFQTPPQMGPDLERLRSFLNGLPQEYRYTFEFRHEGWFAPPVFRILAESGAAFCIYDLAGRQSPREVTADFVYIRLHGPEGPYQGQYGEETLRSWARDFWRWRKKGKEIFCYFDNDQAGYAAQDALRLQAMVGKSRASRWRTGEREKKMGGMAGSGK